jgi:uncharacterized membrane protein
MKVLSRRRFIKTLIYRVTATVVTQSATWILARNIMINAIVLFSDIVVSTLWYYCFETIWKKVTEKWMKK